MKVHNHKEAISLKNQPSFLGGVDRAICCHRKTAAVNLVIISCI